MGTARSTLDALLERITASLQPAAVVLAEADAGAPDMPGDGAGVTVVPVALRRIGRSRRAGALLDLELTVGVAVAGPDALDLLEALLVLAETAGWTVGEGPEPPALGLTLVLPVSVPLDEPTGPPVITTVVDVRPMASMPQPPAGPAAGAGHNPTHLPNPPEGS